MLVDTHCHIHDSEFAQKNDTPQAQILQGARAVGVSQLICVGTSQQSSEEAVTFCGQHSNCYAALALHPHEVADYSDTELDAQMKALKKLVPDTSVVAIGETGLDYFYHDDADTHARQARLLHQHIQLALDNNLPLIFHIRDPKDGNKGLGKAFADFFEIIDRYENVRGVVHSFSANVTEVEGIIKRGLYIGLNGIMTFTKDEKQLDAARSVPLEKLVLETDAPFLTPTPFRGKMCEPKHLRVTAEFLSELRSENFDELARKTTVNAQKLFGI